MILHQVVLLLGSNLGDRTAILAATRERITALVGSIMMTSREYTTQPYGAFAPNDCGEEHPPFLNQALVVATGLGPEAVLDAINKIERELGRDDHMSEYASTGDRLYHDRTIDIDILFYNSEVVDTEHLIIPHPRLSERRFALEPLVEIMPEYTHPILKISMKELFNSLLLGDSQ